MSLEQFVPTGGRAIVNVQGDKNDERTGLPFRWRLIMGSLASAKETARVIRDEHPTWSVSIEESR